MEAASDAKIPPRGARNYTKRAFNVPDRGKTVTKSDIQLEAFAETDPPNHANASASRDLRQNGRPRFIYKAIELSSETPDISETTREHGRRMVHAENGTSSADPSSADINRTRGNEGIAIYEGIPYSNKDTLREPHNETLTFIKANDVRSQPPGSDFVRSPEANEEFPPTPDGRCCLSIVMNRQRNPRHSRLSEETKSNEEKTQSWC